MNAFTRSPKIQALHDLARLSTQMKSGNSGEFKSADPMDTGHNPQSSMIAKMPQPSQHSITPQLNTPIGHATAESDASSNPEAFASKMKNSRLNRVRGVAF